MPRRSSIAALLAAAGLVAGLGAATAHEAGNEAGHEAAAPPGAASEQTVRPVLGDRPLLDQAGAERRLEGDVFGSDLLVLDFIFTSCSTTCPLTSAILSDFRAGLAPELAGQVRFVSISTDPSVDTPERLQAYADAFGADPRWTLLTAEKSVADMVLKDFDAYTTNPEDHPQLVMVGDARSGEFVRVYGLPDPERLGALLAYFAERRARPEADPDAERGADRDAGQDAGQDTGHDADHDTHRSEG